MGDEAVKEFISLEKSAQELVMAAIEARKNAYCPYSNFPVGAAVRTVDGQIYKGCNIESCVYPAGICAERTALCKAVSEGKRDFVACAVVAHQEKSFTAPCGICRQFLSEFVSENIPIFLAKPASPPSSVLCTTLRELLPRSFSM